MAFAFKCLGVLLDLRADFVEDRFDVEKVVVLSRDGDLAEVQLLDQSVPIRLSDGQFAAWGR